MDLQTETPPTTPSAQVVGNAFVEQYYHILHNSPEAAHRFYQDLSEISRPDSNGEMTSVTTMQGINEKILSLDYKDYKAEIKTADAQKSYKDGVVVLVTGCLTGKDNLQRKFTQSFFLAPQDNGYFVLNDVFRYVEDSEPLKTIPVIEIEDSQTVPLNPDSEPSHVPDPPAPDLTTSRVEDETVVEIADDTLDNERQLANEKGAVVDSQSHSNENEVSAVPDSASSSALEDTPKKSYASIVSSQTIIRSSGRTKIYVPTNTVRVVPAKTEKQSSGFVASASVPEASGTSSVSPPESSNAHEEVEGHSIYVRNLPLNITVAELEVEFKKFGPIKQGGIQVRSHKPQGHCFGFVEFQSLSSMTRAIQASPINIGGRQAVVEIKKTTTRVGSWRGRFPPGRGGFRSDGFRGRGNFGGGRAYGRNEFGNRGDFSGRGRGLAGRSGEGYQRGRGRFGRPSGPTQNAVPV